MEEKHPLERCWWECKLLQVVWKTVHKFLRKLKIEVPYDLEILLQGIYTKETKLSQMFIFTPCSLQYCLQYPRQMCSLTNEWIKKTWLRTHTHTGTNTQFSLKERNPANCAKVSQTNTLFLTYVESREIKLMETVVVCGCQRWQVSGRGGGTE